MLLLVLAASQHLAVGAQAVQGSGTLWVMESGDVRAVYSIRAVSPPKDVEVVVVRGGLSVHVYCDGEPVPYEYDAATGALRFLASCASPVVEVYSAEVTSKEGALWRLSVNPQSFPVEVVLPSNAILVGVQPDGYSVTVRDGAVALRLPAGAELAVEYVLAPAVGEASTAAPPPAMVAVAAVAVLAALLALAYLAYRAKFRRRGG